VLVALLVCSALREIPVHLVAHRARIVLVQAGALEFVKVVHIHLVEYVFHVQQVNTVSQAPHMV
jgi:hypothetical protein